MNSSTIHSVSRRPLQIAFAAILVVGCAFLTWKMQAQPADENGQSETLAAESKPDPLDPKIAAALKANELSKEKQQHIWKIEHSTFELETWFGKAFRKALTERDEKALAGFLVSGAEVHVLPSGDGELRTVGPLSETQVRATDVQPEPTDASGLVRSLVDSIRLVKKIERTRLRVLALDTQDGKIWESNILVDCFGTDSEGRHTLVTSHHDVEFRFSDDEDIRQGQIISKWRDEDRSQKNCDGPFLKEVTESTGLAGLPLFDNWKLDHTRTQPYWFQLAVEDFNRDGFPDIAIGSKSGRPLLLRSNQCQSFEDVTREMKIQPWTSQIWNLNLAAWIDFDNDGWPDLLLGDRLYRNQNGEQFDDVTFKAGLKFGSNMMGAAVADYDCDGRADIYIVYMEDPTEPILPGMNPWVGDHENGSRNQLWRNEGDGRFRNVTEAANASGGKRMSFAASWHFLDDDHFPDLYIANDFGLNVHLRNKGDGTFEDVSDETGTAGFATTMGVCSGDINNDGRPEIYSANMYSKMGRRIIRHVGEEDYTDGIYPQIQGACAGNRLYTASLGSMEHTEISELAGVNQVGWAFAPAMADFDADGLLDIYAATGFMSFDRKKPDG